MNSRDVLRNLLSKQERNETLSSLYQYEFTACDEIDGELIAVLIKIIGEPHSIEDTNAFASFLSKTKNNAFIPPLIVTISRDTSAMSIWLADYMYVLINLLNELDDYYPVDAEFVHLLGRWISETEGGEISWKASDVLCDVKSPVSKTYLIQGALDNSLLHLTRINCLRGIVDHFRDDAQNVIDELFESQDENVKEAALIAQDFLN